MLECAGRQMQVLWEKEKPTSYASMREVTNADGFEERKADHMLECARQQFQVFWEKEKVKTYVRMNEVKSADLSVAMKFQCGACWVKQDWCGAF